jgi:ankyrin repeat protein
MQFTLRHIYSYTHMATHTQVALLLDHSAMLAEPNQGLDLLHDVITCVVHANWTVYRRAREKKKDTDIHAACAHIATLLLSHSDTDTLLSRTKADGSTALICAARGGLLELAGVLVEAKADCTVKNAYGHTPLLAAAAVLNRSSCAPMLKQLLAAGDAGIHEVRFVCEAHVTLSAYVYSCVYIFY